MSDKFNEYSYDEETRVFQCRYVGVCSDPRIGRGLMMKGDELSFLENGDAVLKCRNVVGEVLWVKVSDVIEIDKNGNIKHCLECRKALL